MITSRKLSRRRILLFAGAVTGLGAAVLAHANLVEPKKLKVRHLQMTSGTPRHRVVHFTDTHHKGDLAYLKSVAHRINALSPDLVCFTGDLVERAHFLPETLEVLETIKSPLFGVPGNHDYSSHADFGVIRKSFERTGGEWLTDAQSTTAGGRIHMTGLACRGYKVTPLAPKPGGINILMLHYPLLAERVNGKFDLMLAGHSHGGQVRIPLYGALVTPSGVGPYEMGMYRLPAGPLYVNPGIGWMGIPTRIHCRPELTVFDI